MLIPVCLGLTQLLEEQFEPHSDQRDNSQRVKGYSGKADSISLVGLGLLHKSTDITDVKGELVIDDIPSHTKNLLFN